jgi:hypothetical protein
MPENSPNAYERYLTWSTEVALDAASVSPTERLKQAQEASMRALAELKQQVEATGLPKKGAYGPPEEASREAAMHQEAAIRAASQAMEALIKAGQSGTVELMGGVWAYDPQKGATWRPIDELRNGSDQ